MQEGSTPNDLGKVIDVNIEDVMKSSFIDYAMSVIVSRALPDVRDGLKPVQRRILYAMNLLGLAHNKGYKKCARIVGEVLGKYHPHGDSSIYEALVRMAQDFSYRHQLVDGHGNFGSIDGDNAAAMRYTEARMSKIAEEMLKDIEKETVDFVPNFDSEEVEPVVLPTMFPNLLANGATGIAVGMATNIPPHNLFEVIGAVRAYLKNKDITTADLMQYIKGPDFPTGGIILGTKEIESYFETGHGKVRVRAKTKTIDLKNGKQAIIVSEIPYMVNKSTLIENIATLISEKKIDGIAELRDESDKQGLRIYIEVKKYVMPQVVESQLFKHTALENTFGVNMIALVNGAPKVLGILEVIRHFVEYRISVIVRRSKYDLAKARDRAHILEGLRIALANIDEVIEIIKKSRDVKEADDNLRAKFLLTEIQSKAILEMRLSKLTGLEIEKLEAEYAELLKVIEYLEAVIASREKQEEIVDEELGYMAEKYKSDRRTEILSGYDGHEIDEEDMVINDDMMVIITHKGYVKRIPVEAYKIQKRGGKGMTTASKDEEDFIEHIFSAKMLTNILVFTDKGKCHWLKVYKIPEASRTSRGRPLSHLIQFEEGERVKTLLTVETFDETKSIVLVTKNGVINKNPLMAYSRPRKNGILAMKVDEGDQLLSAIVTDGTYHIGVATRKGKIIHFTEDRVTTHGRNTRGVKAISLSENDHVVGIIGIAKEDLETLHVLTVTEKGYGKMTSVSQYRQTNRGGKGVANIKITEKSGGVVAVNTATEESQGFVITEQGKIIRTAFKLRASGRVTQGVKFIGLDKDDSVIELIVEDATTTREQEEEFGDEQGADGEYGNDGSEDYSDSFEENGENSENGEDDTSLTDEDDKSENW